jgi:hypothetical protein
MDASNDRGITLVPMLDKLFAIQLCMKQDMVCPIILGVS